MRFRLIIMTSIDEKYAPHDEIAEDLDAAEALGKESPEDEDRISLSNGVPMTGAQRRRSFLGRLIFRSPSPREDNKNAKRVSHSPEPTPDESSFPPLSPLNLHGYKTTTKHRQLDRELANDIRNLLPARLQLYDDWEMVYSLEQHGISLKTLYRNCDPEFQVQQHRKDAMQKGYGDSIINSMVVGTSAPDHYKAKRLPGYVMVIKDKSNTKFGCFLNEHLRPMDTKRYYGNGQCFLWKCEEYMPHILNPNKQTEEQRTEPATKTKKQSRFKAFMYTGINPNIIYSNHNFISVGSSNGQNGLWIDKSLYKGVSYRCDTFGNEVLCGSEPQDKIGRFDIMGLELWRIGPME